jgi:membrane protease subunit (stomatin/prohibitin family)
VVESVSLPEDLQKVMDQRIGVNMAGDLGRLTQFEAAESLRRGCAESRAARQEWAWDWARARPWRRP